MKTKTFRQQFKRFLRCA